MLLGLAWATGCAAGGPAGIEPLRHAAILEALSAPTRAAFKAGSMSRWAAEPERTAIEARMAIREAHWAFLQTEQPEGEPPRLRALLPDGREATILTLAQPGGVAVLVQVGRTGDAGAEAAYLEALDGLLKGPPSRPRAGKFRLP